VNEFIENELNSREMYLDDHSIKNNKKSSNKEQIMMRSKYHNFDENIENFNKVKLYEGNFNNPHNQNQSQHYENNINVPKKQINVTNNNQNLYVINRKEAKKFEEMLKNSQNVNFNKEIQNMLHQPVSYPNTKMKVGKIFLDPITNNNNQTLNQSKMNFNPVNKKMEVSFKATLQFTDDRGNNNKFEINNPNMNLNNSSIHTNNNSKIYGKKKKMNSFEEQ